MPDRQVRIRIWKGCCYAVNVGYLITRAARRFAHRTAVVAGRRRLTFAEVDDRSNRFANSLHDLGLRPGDRVALILSNCAEYVEIEFGLSKGGFVAVPLNAKLTTQEFLYMINDSGANSLLLGPEYLDRFDGLWDQIPSVRQVIALGGAGPGQVEYEQLLAQASPEPPAAMHRLTLSDLHNIMYTSGTTGKPKGVIHTHRTKWTVALNLLTDLGPIAPDDKLLHVAPLTHGTGFFVLPWFMRGACSVILPQFSPKEVCETIQQERVTVFKLVPTMLIRLLAYPELDQYDLSSLHTIIYGASPMPVDKLREAVQRFGPIFVQIYGQTEALVTICTLGKEEHKVDGTPAEVRRLASAGRPFTNTAVRIVGDDGSDLPPGQVGEVAVTGDHIMAGYWQMSEATAETLRDGWVYTRDLGTMDEQGYLYLVDRKSDMLISGGLNIYPREIEEVLHTHPDVLEVAVFGVPDEHWGEAVKAVVVLRRDATATPEELIAYSGRQLAGFKKPKSIDLVAELPKNAYGKIQKNLLREPYWREYARRVN